ncbi:hypothetical protein PI124_g5069 [Phytophthora idaei]|nr:hypothetical protein PI125_g7457 [Phytophthora idaei]KAG3151507.1 hypothetical protein PI126_g10961 [Phytophthora idaei]KAG3250301.1 hypothetical protein PI124_g5069 [Phytophthora idaei]
MSPEARRIAPASSDAIISDNNQTDCPGSAIPRHTPPPPWVQQVFTKKLVAFSPSKESWMKAKAYKCVGTAYIVGRACRPVKKSKKAGLYQVMWLDSQFQNVVEELSIAVIQQETGNYQAQTKLPDKPARRDLTDSVVDDDVNLDVP